MGHKLFSVIIVLFFFSCLSFGQEKECLLDISASPTLRGLKLGMKKTEVEAVLGNQLNVDSEFIILDLASDLNFLLNNKDQAAEKVISSYEKINSSPKLLGSYDSKTPIFENKSAGQGLKVPSESIMATFIPNQIQLKMTKFKDIEMINLAFFDNKLHSVQIYYKTESYKNLTDDNFNTEILSLLGMPEGILSKSGNASCKNFSIGVGNFNDSIVIELNDLLAKKAIRKKTIQTISDQYDKLKNKKSNNTSFKP